MSTLCTSRGIAGVSALKDEWLMEGWGSRYARFTLKIQQRGLGRKGLSAFVSAAKVSIPGRQTFNVECNWSQCRGTGSAIAVSA